jgi:arylsulfatase A-like enzyme
MFPAKMVLSIFSLALASLSQAATTQPNILWLTSEDNSPYLGCYGDTNARTPHLDRLAVDSVRYLNAFSNAAVCAPARQTLISGIYASSLGGQHMRSKATFPKGVRFFPEYLRQAGYYTSNNSKTDYNGGPADGKGAIAAAWNDSSKRGHWRNRPANAPFFSVFNFGSSHESNLFPKAWEKRELKTDPASISLPAHLPDTLGIRLDRARYYDCLEVMDSQVGKVLAELEADGLAEDTIVFYFSDHGGSMPRGKSFTYDSGTRVPLLLRIPQKWAAWRPAKVGGVSDRPVGFVDFAATALSLAGLKAPAHMQGRAFLGPHATTPREFVHTFRGRRGERYDIVRGVRSRDFLYLRNYTPHLPVMQYNAYSFEIPGYLSWQQAWRAGKTTPAQGQWFEPKVAEELYHIADDPDTVRNLANDPKLAAVLATHRAENDRHLLAVRDSVFFPEGMDGREWAAWQDERAYPMRRLIPLANAVSEQDAANLRQFIAGMADPNPLLRYWCVAGCVTLGKAAAPAREALLARLTDDDDLVRLHAARALAGLGDREVALPVIREALQNRDQIRALRALLAVDECDLLDVDPSLRELIKKASGSYGKRVAAKLLADPVSQ